MDIEDLKKRLRKKKTLDIKIMSGSMEPILQVAKFYKVHTISDDHIPKRFEIFVYWNGRILIGHYYWGQFVDQFTDNQKYWNFKSLVSESEDFPVKRENVIGVVRIDIPRALRFKIMAKFYLRVLRNIRSREATF